MLLDALSILAVVCRPRHFLAWKAGLIRFPDVYTRLHALTKADALGLGFVAVAVALQAASPLVAIKVLLVWLLAMTAGATACNLIADHARRSGLKPWERADT